MTLSAQQTTTDPSPDHVFLMSSRQAIATMREDGMNETRIACVVTEIRSAAIQEERLRLRRLMDDNPPNHIGWPHMLGAINAR
jgi:hypothetical protein